MKNDMVPDLQCSPKLKTSHSTAKTRKILEAACVLLQGLSALPSQSQQFTGIISSTYDSSLPGRAQPSMLSGARSFLLQKLEADPWGPPRLSSQVPCSHGNIIRTGLGHQVHLTKLSITLETGRHPCPSLTHAAISRLPLKGRSMEEAQTVLNLVVQAV